MSDGRSSTTPEGRSASGRSAAESHAAQGLSSVEARWAGLLGATSLAVAVLVVPVTPGVAPLVVGDVAPQTIRAAHGFSFVDHAAWREARAKAASRAPQVFVVDRALLPALRGRVQVAFERARRSPSGAAEAFVADLGVTLPPTAVAAVQEQGFSPRLEAAMLSLLDGALGAGVVLPRGTEAGAGVSLRFVDAGVSVEGQPITSMDEARRFVSMAAHDLGEPAWGSAVGVLTQALIRPNVRFDEAATRRAREAAVAEVEETHHDVRPGETILRAGDVVEARHAELLAAMSDTRQPTSWLRRVMVIAGFVASLSGAMFVFGARYIERFSSRFRDAFAAASLLVLGASSVRAAVELGVVLGDRGGVDATALWFLAPAAGASMLVRILLGREWTVPFAVVSGAVSAAILDLHMLHGLYGVGCALVGAAAVDQTRERLALLRAGAIVGAVGAALAGGMHLVSEAVGVGATVGVSPAASMACAAASGLLSSFLALGLLPLFEAAGFVTDYRLVELGSLNHPVLRQLLLRAPGTYHHSVLVGALAEAGCEAIGANALEAKIAAYFHDIGKAKHPEYFVENQRGINRHDRMDPWESARVIIEHVTEGARVASEQGLPKPILDNIYMHHGTGLLAYFHRRASERSRTPVPEDAFRYPGPKPRSREAGVLMLADKVEAATRTLEAPTPENLAAMIDRIISSVLADGQLSDCDLTFRQLSTVATAFVGVLEGIYHQRITYDETRDLSEARPQRAAVGDGRRPELVALRGGPAEVDAARDEDTDYEAVRHLPGNESP